MSGRAALNLDMQLSMLLDWLWVPKGPITAAKCPLLSWLVGRRRRQRRSCARWCCRSYQRCASVVCSVLVGKLLCDA
jgi:hypothetical protein